MQGCNLSARKWPGGGLRTQVDAGAPCLFFRSNPAGNALNPRTPARAGGQVGMPEMVGIGLYARYGIGDMVDNRVEKKGRNTLCSRKHTPYIRRVRQEERGCPALYT